MKKLLPVAVLLALVATIVVLGTGTALAASSRDSSEIPSPPPPPAGSHLVMNASQTFINQEDSGNVGYWALDNGFEDIQVWQMSPFDFYAILSVNATWSTFAGVPSSNCDANGTPKEGGDGTGPWGGWITFAFKAAAYTPKFGYLGTFDDGGTQANILLGYYDIPGTQTPLQYGPNHADLDSWGQYFHQTGSDMSDSVVGLYQVYHYGSQTRRSCSPPPRIAALATS